MNATFRDFTTDDAARVAAACLSRAAGETIAVEDISPLGEEQRRNHIIRTVAPRNSGDRQHAASLLDRRGASTARFLAGDAVAGVIAFADLSADAPWLAAPAFATSNEG